MVKEKKNVALISAFAAILLTGFKLIIGVITGTTVMIKDLIKVKLILLFFAIVMNTTAQTNEATKTVFGSGKPHVGYFISPSCQFGEIARNTAILPGGGAGVVFNERLYFGINFKYIASENTPEGEADNRLYLDQRYCGLRFEYALRPEKVVHINFPVELGFGDTELDLKDSYEEEGSVPTDDIWFAYLEPGVALEINLHKYLKFSLSAGYRFVSDLSFRSLTEKNLMGMTYSAGLKIGRF